MSENGKLRVKNGAMWRSLTAFEEGLGGRAAIVDALQAAKLDWRQENLLRLLLDPLRARDSLAKICADAGVRGTELIDFFRESTFRAALAEAQTRLMERVPDIVVDATEKAIDHNEDCSCTFSRDGQRIDPLPECPFCSGRGFKRVRSSFDHQQMLLEAATLLKRGGGVSVNVQQNQAVSLGSAFFDKFVKSTDPAVSVEAITVPPSELKDENPGRESQADHPTEV